MTLQEIQAEADTRENQPYNAIVSVETGILTITPRTTAHSPAIAFLEAFGNAPRKKAFNVRNVRELSFDMCLLIMGFMGRMDAMKITA
jgi:hypothetical protein